MYQNFGCENLERKISNKLMFVNLSILLVTQFRVTVKTWSERRWKTTQLFGFMFFSACFLRRILTDFRSKIAVRMTFTPSLYFSSEKKSL